MSVSSDIYLSVLDKIIDGIVVIDTGGKIVRINNTITTMFGYDTNELVGQNIKSKEKN